MKKLLLICCMVVSASAAAQVYKCTVNGKTVYADSPCDSKAAVVPIMRGPTPAETGAARADQTTLKAAIDHRSSIRSAIAASEPMISMTEQDLYAAMGRPNRANTGNYSGTTQDQLIYERSDRTFYVYLTNGIVTSIQNTERIGRRKKECPSSAEIRNWEVDASSITVRDTEAGTALQKKIYEAKTCQ